MQTLKLSLQWSLLFLIVLGLALGCSKGRKQARRKTDAEYRAEGFVQDETGAWVMPGTDNSEGYGDEYDPYAVDDSESSGDSGDDEDNDSESSNDSAGDDEGYGSEYPDEGAAAGNSTDEDTDEDDADDEVTSSDGGYGGGYDSSGYGSSDPYAATQADPKMYTEKVEPILRAKCYNCHGGGPRGRKGDLALNTPAAIQAGDVVYANDPEGSELIYRVTLPTGNDQRMPPKGPGLSKSEITLLTTWIQQGASFGDAATGEEDPYTSSSGQGGGDGYGNGYGGGNASGYGGGNNGGYGDGYGNEEDDGPAPPPQPKNLAEFASRSFQRGNDTLAMRQLHAQALVRSDVGKSVLEKYRWVPALKRASLAVRWGVAIKYQAKDGFEGSPRAVGVVQDLPGDDHDDVDEEEVAFGDFRNRTLDYYAGDIGDELLLRLQNRIERGDYGEVMREELENALASRNGDDDDEFFDDEEDDGGYGRGGGGGGYDSGYGSGYGGGRGGRGGDDDNSNKPDGEKIEQLMPGVTLLGVGSGKELFDRARKENVDILVVFDVVADPNSRLRIVNTSTRVRFYDVLSEDQVAISGKINNIAIQKTLAEDGEDGTVLKEMDKVFTAIDDKYRVKPFPKATSEKAQKSVIGFVKATMAHPSQDPLWKLGEVRFYESCGALKPVYAAAAFKKILPSEAAKLKNVTDDDEIQTLLANWIDSEEEESASPEEEDDGPKRPKRTFR